MKKQYQFLLLAVVLFGSACNDYKTTRSGLKYKVYSDGKGQQLQDGGYVKFNMVRKLKDSVLSNSYGSLPLYDMVRKGMAVHDLPEVFPGLRVGDSILLIQNPDTVKKYQGGDIPGLTKNDRIVSTVKILGYFDSLPVVINDYLSEMRKQVDRENVKVEEYLRKNNVKAVKSPKGIYVEIKKEGDGPACDSGKFAKVWYTGSTLRGNTFDSNRDSAFHHNEPMSFQIEQQGLIPGWSWGMQVLKQGGIGVLYIPPTAGYGKKGNGNGQILGDDILKFEIEVISVTDSMPPSPKKLALGGK